MPKSKEQREFERIRKQYLKDSFRLERDAVKRLKAQLEAARQRVADAILKAEGFDLIHYQQIKRNIEQVMRDFAFKYKDVLDSDKVTAFDLGVGMFDEPLMSTKAALTVTALPEISLSVLEAQMLRNTQFITGLSTDAATKINNAILLGITGEKTPFEVMKDVGRNLRDRSVFRSIFDRAETIVRTEISDALNTATLKRFEQAADKIEGLEKYWIHSGRIQFGRPGHKQAERETNPNKGGIPIPVNQDFRVRSKSGRVDKAKGPHDVRLPADQTVNCGCRLGLMIA